MTTQDILAWLREDEPSRLEELWRQADAVRRANVGDAVHVRGLVEFSNHCRRNCLYCGLRAPNGRLLRYRMSAQEILDCARQAVAFGYGTLVLQSGEDAGVAAEWLADVIRRVKTQTPLAVTLSAGERSPEDYTFWRRAGADRYLLRFETSNRKRYDQIHPPVPDSPGATPKYSWGCSSVAKAPPSKKRLGVAPSLEANAPGLELCHNGHPRVAILRCLRELGYEIGSGVMIGIPGQSWDDLAGDIELFAELDLDMIGCGPFIPHPDTPLGSPDAAEAAGGAETRPDQVPADELTTYKVIALARLACPRANIPATTALATLNRANGRELGLARGANVIMPNLTPPAYRRHYEIYPDKACLYESADACRSCLHARIAGLGRSVGQGRGDARRAG